MEKDVEIQKIQNSDEGAKMLFQYEIQALKQTIE